MSNKSIVSPALYRHYKGGIYEVLDVGLTHDEATKCVIYRRYQVENSTWFIRRLDHFTEMVGEGLNQVPRFQYYGPIPATPPTTQSSRLSIDEFFAIAGKERWHATWETWRSLIKHFTNNEILDDDSSYQHDQATNADGARKGYNHCTVKLVAEPPKEKPWQDKWQSVANAPAATDSPSTDENGVIQSGPYKGDSLVTAKPATEFKHGAFTFLMTSCTDIPPVISTMGGERYDWISTDMGYVICDKFNLICKVKGGEPVVARLWPKSDTDSVYQTSQSRTHDKDLSSCTIDGNKHEHLRLPVKPRARLAAADWITKNGQTYTVDKGTLVEYERGWKDRLAYSADGKNVSVYWVDATILEGPHQGEKITITSLNLAAENV